MTTSKNDEFLNKGLHWLMDSFTGSMQSFQVTDIHGDKLWVTLNSGIPSANSETETGADLWNNALAKRQIFSEEMDYDYPVFEGPDESDAKITINAMGSMRSDCYGYVRCVCFLKRWYVDENMDTGEDAHFEYEILYISYMDYLGRAVRVEPDKPICIGPWCIQNLQPEKVG